MKRLLARLHRRLFPRLHLWSHHYRHTTEGEPCFFVVRECRLCGRREIRHDPHPSWDEWQEESVARLTLFDSARERYRRLYDTARRADA